MKSANVTAGRPSNSAKRSGSVCVIARNLSPSSRHIQTLKRWLSHQPHATTLTQLQTQLDTFAQEYNHHRPHCALPHQATPSTIYTTRPKATPGQRLDSHHRVRTDRVDNYGSLSLRVNGRLHHISIGRAHARTRVLMLICDLDIRIINAATGELIRTSPSTPPGTTNPAESPADAHEKSPEPPMRVQSYSDVVRHHREPMTGIEPAYSAWEADVLPLNYIGTTSSAGDHEG
jgi:hypothetical protein